MQVNTGSNGGLKSARAGIRFELYSIQLPVITDAIGRRLDIKILLADMSCIKPPRPLQGGARGCVTLACQKRAHDCPMGRPAGLKTFRPAAVGLPLHVSRTLAAGKPEGIYHLIVR
jgi:hypothetical protein